MHGKGVHMSRSAAKRLSLLMLGLVSAVTAADDPTQRISFAAGANSATVTGAVAGYRSLRYLLAGRAGQVMSISFAPSKKTLYYSVLQGTHTLRDGSSEDSPDWSATLTTGGDYVIDVFLKSGDAKRNVEATFTLTVALSNATVSYFCADGRRLAVTYVNDLEPGSARVVVAGNAYVLPQVVSGSGARYSDGKITWWNKGREGTLELGAPATQCSE
jgi:membrane-bound inhibitor of C-type lysozyme